MAEVTPAAVALVRLTKAMLVDNRSTEFSRVYPIVQHSLQKDLLQKDNEHYRLLHAVARQVVSRTPSEDPTPTPFKSQIIDIGSHHGLSMSALLAGCLAAESNNTSGMPRASVVCFDREPWKKQLAPDALAFATQHGVDVKPSHVDFFSCTDEFLRTSAIVAIDVEPHDGQYERRIIERLMCAGFRGIAVVDEIRATSAMASMWKWIPLKKLDVTDLAHWSGTGIVVFDPSYIDVVVG